MDGAQVAFRARGSHRFRFDEYDLQGFFDEMFEADGKAAAGYHVDVVYFRPGRGIQTHRFLHEDLAAVSERWSWGLRRLVEKMPSDRLEPILSEEIDSNVTPIVKPQDQ